MPDEFKMINATKEEACRIAEAEAIRAKTGGTDPLTYDFNNAKGFADAIAAIPSGGITPSGKKLITDTSETDVAAFATAQISSDTLLAENIKKDVNILGVVGSFESGGGSVQEAEVTTASVTNTIQFTFDVDTSKTTWWLIVVSHDANEFPDATPTTGSFRFACHGTVKGTKMSNVSYMQTTRNYQAGFNPTRNANGFTILANYAQFAGGATYKAYYCEVK